MALEMQTETYTPERKAEFLLNNATDADEYRLAVEEACRLGVDPTRLQYLFREEPWQNPAAYLPEIAIAALRR